jgi:hypothetical protein
VCLLVEASREQGLHDLVMDRGSGSNDAVALPLALLTRNGGPTVGRGRAQKRLSVALVACCRQCNTYPTQLDDVSPRVPDVIVRTRNDSAAGCGHAREMPEIDCTGSRELPCRSIECDHLRAGSWARQ